MGEQMMHWRRALAATLAACLVLCGSGASAWAAPASVARAEDPADVALVQGGFEVVTQGGILALSPRIAALEAMLARAPQSFPSWERHGDVLFVRPNDNGEIEGLIAEAQAQGGARPKSVQVGYNVYPLASLLLGSYWNEVHEPAKAVAAMDRGLALQPRNGVLVGERGTALADLKKFDQAVASYDAWLASGTGTDLQRARILRARGFSLIELNRLDEAEQNYLDSLKLEPCHAGARNELAYIAGRRTGTEHSSPSKLVTYDKAKGTCSPA